MPMQILNTLESFQKARKLLSGTVAFVPTMGYLHDGHLSLMREAKKHCDHVVVSIFVNPTQFGPNEDLDTYPRDPEGDQEKCRQQGCDLLFIPCSKEIYGPHHTTTVHVSGLLDVLCGPHRPGHFDGVATIVTKLFNIVSPDVALFGEKDYQQLAVIRKLTEELNFPIQIIGCPTVRESDGLAMSSRNRYLSAIERQDALALSQALALAWHAYARGERDASELVSLATRHIQKQRLDIDYVECVHPTQLYDYTSQQALISDDEGAVLALAVNLGSARLIDNLRLDRPLPQCLSLEL